MAYIFHRVNGVWKEEFKPVSADGASGDWLEYDVDLYVVTDIIGYTFDNDMGINNGYVYVFSYGAMENRRRHRNLFLHMRRLAISLELVWPYLVIPLSLVPSMITRGAMIADMIMCTPLLAGSGTRVAREFLRMVQLIMRLVIILPFRGVTISSVPFMQE